MEFLAFLVNSVFHERLVGEVGYPSRLRRKGNAPATSRIPYENKEPSMAIEHEYRRGNPAPAGERVTSGALERNGKWSLPGRIEQIQILKFRNVGQRQKAATKWGNSSFSRIPPYGVL